MTRLRLWRFIWSRRLWWFQRRRPVAEFRTRIYEGKPGQGKTLCATRDGIELMRQGVRVVSNYRIRDPQTGQESILMASWFDMLEWAVRAMAEGQRTVFVIDEIHLWCNSRFFAKTPGWWLNLVAQRRHYGVGIIGTTQNLRRVEVTLRELVDDLVRVRNRTFARVPLFVVDVVEPESVEAEVYQVSDGAFTLMPWYAYGGYSTCELQAVEEWAEDDDLRDRIAGLLARAQGMSKRERIPAFTDWLRDVQAAQDAA